MPAAATDSDPLIREFREHLERLRAAARSPGEELDALLLIGVEREALVTVAYHDDAVAARVARMPVDEDVRAIVARAVRWVWRDEEGHTLWVRGALLRRHDPLLRARALGAQVGGWIAGFVASSQAHRTWREAPVRRALAEVIEASAVVAGKVPPEVREHLHHLSFRDFCRFQASAEATAMLGWERAATLAADPSTGAPLHDADGFRRLAEDEGRHARLFAVLAEAFDEHDRAVIDAPTLRERIAAVGQRFLARPDAPTALANPLGKGAPVIVRTGEDPRALVEEVLERSGLEVPRGARVALKTTLQLVTRRADPSPGVSVALLAALRQALLDRGAEVVVLDAPNLYATLRRGRSVDEVRRWLGVPFEIADAQADQVPHAYPRGVGEDTVSAAWRDADLRVLFGKLRSHPTSSIMGALEAAEGLGARDDDVLFADRRTERETATLMVLDAFPAHLCLVDAWDAVPDGLLGMMGTSRPLSPRRLYASRDGVALDRVVARHAGVSDDERGLLVHAAEDWFGRPASEVDGPDTPLQGFRLPDHDARTALLSSLAWPVWAWAGMRGALFAPDFDDDFPPIEAARGEPAVAALRALVRRLVSDEPHGRWPGLLPTEVVPVRGHRVRVARAGAGGRCFVLLHGYPDDLQVWSALAPLLAPHGRVLAFDWPGLGASDPHPSPADPEGLAAHLLAVLDAEGIERAVLVGHDMGAAPALCLAAHHPERVERVVVMNALLFADEPTSTAIAILRRAGLSWAAFRLAPGVVFDRAVASFLPREALPDELREEMRATFLRPSTTERVAAMCTAYEEALPELPRTWFDTRTPVLAVWGEREPHFDVAHARRLVELLPNARATVLPGAPHWMALTDPAMVAAQILAGSPEVS